MPAWMPSKRLALAGLETAHSLVDDIKTALTPHDAVVAVALAQGLDGIADFHENAPKVMSATAPGRPGQRSKQLCELGVKVPVSMRARLGLSM